MCNTHRCLTKEVIFRDAGAMDRDSAIPAEVLNPLCGVPLRGHLRITACRSESKHNHCTHCSYHVHMPWTTTTAIQAAAMVTPLSIENVVLGVDWARVSRSYECFCQLLCLRNCEANGERILQQTCCCCVTCPPPPLFPTLLA